MDRTTKAIIVIACLGAASAAFFVFDNWIFGAIFLAWSVMILAFFGGKDERVRPGAAEGIDPAAVKEYRRQHPGTSIVEAVNSVGR